MLRRAPGGAPAGKLRWGVRRACRRWLRRRFRAAEAGESLRPGRAAGRRLLAPASFLPRLLWRPGATEKGRRRAFVQPRGPGVA